MVEATTVHPRVCGERNFLNDLEDALIGSSPRVRGTLCAKSSGEANRRFIPACAGNAQRVHITGRSVPVHPRVCGERAILVGVPLYDGGSSPRVRGTHARAQTGHINDRFIPACAGNARRRRRRGMSSPVHPRVCGERPR